MKLNIDFKKGAEVLEGVKQRTAEIAQKTTETSVQVASNVVENVQKSAKEFSEKSKHDNYERRMKKYNPLFRDVYDSDDFFVPNIIRIVDDAVRRDIDVCKGAIGWREKKRGSEILFLYDEFVEQSGLRFVPAPICDEIYYIDAHDKKRFIKLDRIFQQAHEEKLAELENIAYCLGAKYCSIQIEEKEIKHDKKKANAAVQKSIKESGAELGTITESIEVETVNDSKMRCTSKSVTTFKGNDDVTEPVLKWFAHDNNVLNLIEYRCKGGNLIESKTLTLSGASSATMSHTAAANIDAAVMELGVKQNYGMEDKSVKECSQTIVYCLEF